MTPAINAGCCWSKYVTHCAAVSNAAERAELSASPQRHLCPVEQDPRERQACEHDGGGQQCHCGTAEHERRRQLARHRADGDDHGRGHRAHEGGVGRQVHTLGDGGCRAEKQHEHQVDDQRPRIGRFPRSDVDGRPLDQAVHCACGQAHCEPGRQPAGEVVRRVDGSHPPAEVGQDRRSQHERVRHDPAAGRQVGEAPRVAHAQQQGQRRSDGQPRDYRGPVAVEL